jgi:hypothetical protein
MRNRERVLANESVVFLLVLAEASRLQKASNRESSATTFTSTFL